jgi:hypothetical protein
MEPTPVPDAVLMKLAVLMLLWLGLVSVVLF